MLSGSGPGCMVFTDSCPSRHLCPVVQDGSENCDRIFQIKHRITYPPHESIYLSSPLPCYQWGTSDFFRKELGLVGLLWWEWVFCLDTGSPLALGESWAQWQNCRDGQVVGWAGWGQGANSTWQQAGMGVCSQETAPRPSRDHTGMYFSLWTWCCRPVPDATGGHYLHHHRHRSSSSGSRRIQNAQLLLPAPSGTWYVRESTFSPITCGWRVKLVESLQQTSC